MDKVFGVGLWKTGTKSLGKAFQILGFRDHRAFNSFGVETHKLSIEELHDFKTWEDKSNEIFMFMGRYEAFTDTPWHFLYKWVLKAYPGAKFILTLRDSPEAYAESEYHHCLAHGMPKERIPTKKFFIDRYNFHNDIIREYFHNKNNKLLEMQIETATWGPMCEFLNKPIPSEPFPHLNKRRPPQ